MANEHIKTLKLYSADEKKEVEYKIDAYDADTLEGLSPDDLKFGIEALYTNSDNPIRLVGFSNSEAKTDSSGEIINASNLYSHAVITR